MIKQIIADMVASTEAARYLVYRAPVTGPGVAQLYGKFDCEIICFRSRIAAQLEREDIRSLHLSAEMPAGRLYRTLW